MDTPANLLCDNQSVVLNTMRVESTLQRKHNAIAYHYVREQVAAGMIRVGKVASEANLADPLTKVLPLVQRRWLFDQWILALAYTAVTARLRGLNGSGVCRYTRGRGLCFSLCFAVS